jgi:hypothetical protein
MSSLYLPGRGMVDLAAARVATALAQYDERLIYHPSSPQTGQPTVFVKMDADYDTGIQIDGNNVMPVLAFAEPPTVEYALKSIMERDSLRHGLSLLEDIRKNNASIKAEKEYEAKQADEAAAEAYEWYARNTGQTEHKRVYMSGRKARG